MNRVAIIDMGTNTFHLLVAEKKGQQFNILFQDRIATKIGAGGINGGYITAEGQERALHALILFKNKATELGVQKIIAFGTSALRNANNGQEIINSIHAKTGIEAKIISGDEEASLIYHGVRQAVKLGDQKSLIVDIGGGSVEFIIANDSKIFWKRSFEVGGQRLIEKFHQHDPILPEEIASLTQFLEEALDPLFVELKKHDLKTLIGSSGSFDTLSEIYCLRNNIEYNTEPETPLTIKAFGEIFQELLTKNRAARMQIPGMIEMRVDMIVAACCLIQSLLWRYPFQSIRVSTYSLKEGVLAELSELGNHL